jgi:hypothetical protein
MRELAVQAAAQKAARCSSSSCSCSSSHRDRTF